MLKTFLVLPQSIFDRVTLIYSSLLVFYLFMQFLRIRFLIIWPRIWLNYAEVVPKTHNHSIPGHLLLLMKSKALICLFACCQTLMYFGCTSVRFSPEPSTKTCPVETSWWQNLECLFDKKKPNDSCFVLQKYGLKLHFSVWSIKTRPQIMHLRRLCHLCQGLFTVPSQNPSQIRILLTFL